jgi:hypothetical protein
MTNMKLNGKSTTFILSLKSGFDLNPISLTNIQDIGQQQFGISINQPLGTSDLIDCLCLMVHDPISKKTALAHIDRKTAIRSLDAIFQEFPDSELQVRLVG